MILKESPDSILTYDKSIRSDDAYTFLFYNNNPYIFSNIEYKQQFNKRVYKGYCTHNDLSDIFSDLKNVNLQLETKFNGRLWYNKNKPYPTYISFWDYPKGEEIKMVLYKLCEEFYNRYNIKIDPKSFIIEAIDLNNKEAQELIDKHNSNELDDMSFSYQMQDIGANIYVNISDYIKLNDKKVKIKGIDHLKGSKPQKNWGSSYYSNKYPNTKPEDIMRYKAATVGETLLEASSEDIYEKYYKDIPIEIYQKIVKNDPTSTDRKNGKYVKWMIDQYKKMIGERTRQLFIEDLYKLKEALDYFNKYPQQFIKQQIQQYSYYDFKANYDDLKDDIDNMNNYDYNKNSNNDFNIKNLSKQDLKDIKTNETKKIFENSDWLIISPLTMLSSCFWGLGTKWCTAASNIEDNAFDDYSNELCIIIDKKHKDNNGRQIKYQFHADTYSYMNSSDHSIFNENDEYKNIPQDIWIEYYNFVMNHKKTIHKYISVLDTDDKQYIINKKGIMFINYYDDESIICDKDSFEPNNEEDINIDDYSEYIITYVDESKTDYLNVIELSSGKYIFDNNYYDILLIKINNRGVYKLSINNSINPDDLSYNFAHINGKFLLKNNANYVEALTEDDELSNESQYYIIYDNDDNKNVLDLYNDELLLNTWISSDHDIYIINDDIYIRDPNGYEFTIEEYK